jgi:hypothetical protein
MLAEGRDGLFAVWCVGLVAGPRLLADLRSFRAQGVQLACRSSTVPSG